MATLMSPFSLLVLYSYIWFINLKNMSYLVIFDDDLPLIIIIIILT